MVRSAAETLSRAQQNSIGADSTNSGAGCLATGRGGAAVLVTPAGRPIGWLPLIVTVAFEEWATQAVSLRNSGGISRLTGVESKGRAPGFKGVTAIAGMSGGPSGSSPVDRLGTRSVGFASDGGLTFVFVGGEG
ncbi:MAG TPA: hypothetical protein VGI60_09170 [Chthoniobacterales bacterium]|jgi:hypothetical protein